MSKSSPASSVDDACRTVAWWNVRELRIPLLPFRGFAWLLGALVVLLVGLLLSEWMLAESARRGKLNSREWQREDALILRNSIAKIQTNPELMPWNTRAMTPPARTPERQRILVVGDSFVWGDGLANLNHVWWRQLQWELERRGYWTVDVLALGARGASTQDQLGWLLRGNVLAAVKPDVLIFGYVTNDPIIWTRGRKVPLVPSLEATPTDRSVFLSQLEALFPNLGFQLGERYTARQQRLRSSSRGWSYADWEMKLLEGPNFMLYRDVARVTGELAAELKSQGKPMFFVATPNLPSAEYFSPRHRPVQELFTQLGIDFFDLLPDFTARYSNLPPTAFSASPANGHPGPLTTHFYAVQIADLLERHYRQVLGQKSPRPSDMRPRINDWLPASMGVEDMGSGQWRISLAEENESPRLPLERPHGLLSFERPVRMSGISIRSADTRGLHLYASTLAKEHDHESPLPIYLGQAGAGHIPIDPEWRVTSIRVAWDRNSHVVRDLALTIDFVDSPIH